jgi:hypothetical protein
MLRSTQCKYPCLRSAGTVGSHTYTPLVAPSASVAPTLCLHGVRLLGGADTARVAARFGLDHDATLEALLDFEAVGWVSRTEFGGVRAWSLTDTGRAENERQLAAELDACGGRDETRRAHEEFVALNGRFLQAVTDWQLRPMSGATLVSNDHSDFRWDDRVIERLVAAGRGLQPVCDGLSGVLTRFDGFGVRYVQAVRRVQAGQTRWVDGIDLDSCHVVWMQLHEDLLATLGLRRGDGS